jgi:hypothetical protein
MRKMILAAAAVGTLAAPAVAMATNRHKTPAKGTTVHACVSRKKHGFKVRVSRKCTHGEKPITLHVAPAGPQGNGLTVTDANGNAVGTAVGFDGYYITMILSDGTIQNVVATTGQIDYVQPEFQYASADCTGPAYISWSASPQMPFAAPDHSAVGDQLYTASASTVPLNVGSVYDAGTGCSTASSVDSSAHAVNATGTAITTSGFAGPLTIKAVRQ